MSEFVHWESDRVKLYLGGATSVLNQMDESSVDCIVTSPPYYGQRDYNVENQIGLEATPQEFVTKLVEVFCAAKRVLKPTGSLWVNIGDTYWSGKGTPHGADAIQKNRRFTRPQDRTGIKPLCQPKQLLLVPHRFAIAMQESGWIVRNDNVWHKKNPTPDPIRDRSASAHEYMFHFVQQKKYYYDFDSVSIPTADGNRSKPPASVWSMTNSPSFKKHIAPFPEGLVSIPIRATLPANGVFLDVFCGSATALSYAISHIKGTTAIGIDISQSALNEAKELLMAHNDI